jgi:tetratricopeptide (TPR) repeat protein
MSKLSTLRATAVASMLLFSFALPARAADMRAAKNLYAAAAFDDALAELRAVEAAADGTASREEIEQYRALCYIALNKNVEARQALERLVNIKPSYAMSETELSPKLVTMFRNVRQRELPVIIKDLYARGKVSIDARRYTAAQAEFAQMLALIDDRDVLDRATMGDMKTLAQGFMKLAELEQANADARLAASAVGTSGTANQPAPGIPSSMAAGLPSTQAAQRAAAQASGSGAGGRGAAPSANASQPGSQPAQDASPTTAVTPTPALLSRIYTEADEEVALPVELSRVVPEWTPPPLLKNATLRGVMEIVINERGTVDTAVLTQPISPYYDSSLLNAAKGWKYTPATVNGRPVKFKKVMTIVLRPLQ